MPCGRLRQIEGSHQALACKVVSGRAPDTDSGARRADTQPVRIRTKDPLRLLMEGRRAYGGAQFGSRSWQAAIGRVRSADRSNLRFHVSRTVADTVSNSYGSEGWEFESLRARHRNTVSYEARCRCLRFFSVADVDLYPRVYPRTVLAFTP
jgi:hypothetical protein